MNKTKKITKIYAMLAIFATASAMLPGPAEAVLQTVGPVSPDNGFPVWYQDANGLALEFCKDPANPFCLADPVIIGNLFSEAIGFGSEAFYWTTEALMDSKLADGTNGRALMVLALESAFLNEAPAQGDQMTFGRLRFFIDVPTAGRYKVTHPYGVAFFDISPERIIATNGVRAINANRLAESGFDAAASTNIPLGDFGCDVAPCNFSLALNSGVGPFLTWDTFNISPSLTDPLLIDHQGNRYVGNPMIEHAITGSPFGTNIFQIEAPAEVDLDPLTPGTQTIIETNLFSVSGKIAVIDTVPPTIDATPKTATLGSVNMVANAHITDDLGVTRTTIDFGTLGNTLISDINAAQEVPATLSTATGNGTFTIDTAANTLTFSITFSGLIGGAETAAHIHGPASAGINALPVFDLPLGTLKNGVWNYPETMEADILAGRTYVNIHSVLFPSGEIRGQILPQTNVQNMILTSGTRTDGIWGAIIPVIDRLGTFNLPIEATDGSNTANGTLTLSVVPVLNSVAVTPALNNISVGGSVQLTAAGTDPANNPIASGLNTTWSSDNDLFATVDANGLVTGVGAGSAVITATMTNGVNTVSGTATVNVTAPSACQTTADTDNDGIISNLEILNFVRSWKAGLISNLEILRAIGFWKAGTGC